MSCATASVSIYVLFKTLDAFPLNLEALCTVLFRTPRPALQCKAKRVPVPSQRPMFYCLTPLFTYAWLSQNAGIASPKVSLEDVPLDSFQALLATNIAAPFMCTQEAFKIMKAQVPGGGRYHKPSPSTRDRFKLISDPFQSTFFRTNTIRIINNGSVSAHAPRPLSAPYTLSKHAISGLTKSTALDGRPYNIACSQLDIGNAQSVMSAAKTDGVLQADGSIRVEAYVQIPLLRAPGHAAERHNIDGKIRNRVMDVEYAAAAIVYMASLPLEVNVLNQVSALRAIHRRIRSDADYALLCT